MISHACYPGVTTETDTLGGDALIINTKEADIIIYLTS